MARDSDRGESVRSIDRLLAGTKKVHLSIACLDLSLVILFNVRPSLTGLSCRAMLLLLHSPLSFAWYRLEILLYI